MHGWVRKWGQQEGGKANRPYLGGSSSGRDDLTHICLLYHSLNTCATYDPLIHDKTKHEKDEIGNMTPKGDKNQEMHDQDSLKVRNHFSANLRPPADIKAHLM